MIARGSGKLAGIGRKQTINGRGEEDAVRGALDKKEQLRMRRAALGAGDKHPRDIAPSLPEEDPELVEGADDLNANFYAY